MTEEETRKNLDDIATAYRTLFLDFPAAEAQLWLGLGGEKESLDVVWTGYDALTRVASALTDENMELYRQWGEGGITPEQGEADSSREQQPTHGKEPYPDPANALVHAHEQRRSNAENLGGVHFAPFPAEQSLSWWRVSQEMASWSVDIGEQIATTQALALQRQATFLAQGTPWEPALDFQQHLTSQWLSQVSAFVRACWGLPLDEKEER
ncbi:MAG: hypothetical protein AB7G75_00770 [Candidatus Binatia bacterium]